MNRRLVLLTGSLAVMAALLAGYVANLAIGMAGPQAAAAGAVPPSASLATESTIASTAAGYDQLTEAAYKRACRSVVYVNNPSNGTGSGVIYDSTGDIVTNAHVTSGSKKFKVTLWDGRKGAATLVATDQADDLAVIHVHMTGLRPATFAKSGGFDVAQTVLAIGSPIGLQDSVSIGLISGTNRTEQEPNGAYIPNAIQTSAPINPGNSGGALVALNGHVVGIPTMVQTSTTGNEPVQNIGFAIPSPRVRYIVGQILKHGKVLHTGRAFLGVVPANSTGGGYLGQSVSGALLTSVESGGPAGKAGLRSGDVITKVGDTSINSADDLLSALAHLKPGDRVIVKYNDNGTSHSTSVLLGELPASG